MASSTPSLSLPLPAHARPKATDTPREATAHGAREKRKRRRKQAANASTTHARVSTLSRVSGCLPRVSMRVLADLCECRLRGRHAARLLLRLHECVLLHALLSLCGSLLLLHVECVQLAHERRVERLSAQRQRDRSGRRGSRRHRSMDVRKQTRRHGHSRGRCTAVRSLTGDRRASAARSSQRRGCERSRCATPAHWTGLIRSRRR